MRRSPNRKASVATLANIAAIYGKNSSSIALTLCDQLTAVSHIAMRPKNRRRQCDIQQLQAIHKARANTGRHHAPDHPTVLHALALEDKQIRHRDNIVAQASNFRNLHNTARAVLQALELDNHMDGRGDLLAN